MEMPVIDAQTTEHPKVYALIEFSFQQSTCRYITFDLEVAKQWESQYNPYGHYEYEEMEVYEP
jgi:hypothetical protein